MSLSKIIVIFISFIALAGCANNTEKGSAAKRTIDGDSNRVITVNTSGETAKKADRHLSTTAAGGSTKYTIDTPEGWTKTADTVVKGGGRYVQLTSPEEMTKDDFRESINVITEKLLKPGLDNYASSGKINMLKHIPGITILKEGDANLNGLPAKWMKYGFMYGPVPHTNLLYMLIKNDVGYAITCNSETTTFDRYEHSFKKAVNTFRITE